MNLLLDSAFKATLILSAAWIASLALRRASADVRYKVWLAAMLAVALVPAVLSIPQSMLPSPAGLFIPVLAAGARIPAAPSTPWLAIVWAAGAFFCLARLILGLFAALRITRSARDLDGILFSDRATTPMTWGFWKPVVILPAYAAEWDAAERQMVLRHERAHIERHDWLWQTVSNIVTAVFWFHPLMWLAKFELRREAEGAADDLVLGAGASPSDYAGRLVEVARSMGRISAPFAAIPMVRKPELDVRVRSILDPARRRGTGGILARCLIALAAIALIVPIVVTRSHVYAQGKVYKMTDGITPPSILYKQEPAYTEEARADKVQGVVALSLQISADGYAQNIQVTRSLDSGLDDEAVKAVTNWRFKPGMKDGKPVAVYANIEVVFRLQ